ncbi:hypothetical protein [Clostridium cellulovorans]|nr:hypothetical protein [Clostridium cellulovorans]
MPISKSSLICAWADKSNFSYAKFDNAIYDLYTIWPSGFNPAENGAVICK